METVHLVARADGEGHLTLDVPESMRGLDLQVTVEPQEPIDWSKVPRNELGWPIGFLEHYLGSMPDFPEEPEDSPAEDVDPL